MHPPTILLLMAGSWTILLQSEGASEGKAGGDAQFVCPEPDGFFPHRTQCDLYYRCEAGVPELRVCGNGLAFDDTNSRRENCDYLFAVDCSKRPQLEPPVGNAKCPRLYGIFADESSCDVFWNCWNGEANRYQCAPGLAFHQEKKVCMWADQVPECKQEEIGNGFRCPSPEQSSVVGTFTRHPHPEDCRKYYICIEGLPREYGCPLGTVYKIGDDDQSGFCTDPEDVPDCEDYYGDLDLKSLKRAQNHAGLYDYGSSQPKKTPKSVTRKQTKATAAATSPKASSSTASSAKEERSTTLSDEDYLEYEYVDEV